jgi:competence protein ComEA
MNSSWLDRNRHLVFISVLLIALGGVLVFYFFRQPAEEPIEVLPAGPPAEVTVPSNPTTPVQVRIYITGAVVHPDVYVLPQGSIIKDAVRAAGGFTGEADWDRINQALELKDQQHVHIPRLGESDAPLPVPEESTGQTGQESQATSAPGGLIDLNTATLEQLDSLPGIGPAIAQRIIDYREQVGGFKTIEEITEVKGIGDATLAKIKDQITVSK